MRRSLLVQVLAAIFAISVLANASAFGQTSCDATSSRLHSPPQVLQPTSGSQLQFASAVDPPIAIDGGVGDITNIGEFLERCPTNDPVYHKLRIDFEIRRNDEVVGEIPCSEPISSIPIADYTEELITLQGLRTMFWMDRGLAGHLPWTHGTLYDWMASRIGGINIKGDRCYCCEQYDGKLFIVVSEGDDFNRDFDRKWRGLSGNIALYAHEARHVDGHPHSSCCGITGGCDDDFLLADLSPYGVQWWLAYSWLMGGINVGISCLDPIDTQQIASWHNGGLESGRSRFCYSFPPEVTSLPALPGGPCPVFSAGFESGSTGRWSATIPPPPPHRVFVSSKTFSPDFANLALADLFCRYLASNAGLSGIWKALISGANQSVQDRVVVGGRVVNMSGQTIAVNAEDFWDGTAINPPDLSELGQPPADTVAWVGNYQHHCQNWTTIDPSVSGTQSMTTNTNAWLYGSSYGPCANKRSLLCISQ